jgi:enoyl-CoA hydratase
MVEDRQGVIRYHVDEGIAVLTIDRPEKLNSMTPEGFAELRRELLEADSNTSVKIIILTGAGRRAFSTGFDILDIPELTIAESRLLHIGNLELNRTISGLNKIIIAAVNGAAMGAGFEISLLCDLTVAARSAVFAMPELAIGAYPGTIAPTLLWQLVGIKKAKELIFTGKTINADEAAELGLVNEVVPDDALMDRAIQLARQIMHMAQLPLLMAKARMNSMLRVLLEEEMSRFVEVQTLVFTSADFKEGTKALKEKRKPVFTGE